MGWAIQKGRARVQHALRRACRPSSGGVAPRPARRRQREELHRCGAVEAEAIACRRGARISVMDHLAVVRLHTKLVELAGQQAGERHAALVARHLQEGGGVRRPGLGHHPNAELGDRRCKGDASGKRMRAGAARGTVGWGIAHRRCCSRAPDRRTT
eukprot:4856030-Prymnesium_polylepis.5